MTKIDLTQIIGILANIGVIAGIIFLAVELQQNNDLLAAQTRAVRIQMRLNNNDIVVQNDALLRSLSRYRRNEELTDEDELRLLFYARRGILGQQYAWIEARQGIIEETTIPVESWSEGFRSDRIRQAAWADIKSGLDPEFVKFFEENVIGP